MIIINERILIQTIKTWFADSEEIIVSDVAKNEFGWTESIWELKISLKYITRIIPYLVISSAGETSPFLRVYITAGIPDRRFPIKSTFNHLLTTESSKKNLFFTPICREQEGVTDGFVLAGVLQKKFCNEQSLIDLCFNLSFCFNMIVHLLEISGMPPKRPLGNDTEKELGFYV